MLEQNGVFFFVGNPTWVMNAVLQLVHQKGRLSKDQEEVPETLYLMPDLCMELDFLLRSAFLFQILIADPINRIFFFGFC